MSRYLGVLLACVHGWVGGDEGARACEELGLDFVRCLGVEEREERVPRTEPW